MVLRETGAPDNKHVSGMNHPRYQGLEGFMASPGVAGVKLPWTSPPEP